MTGIDTAVCEPTGVLEAGNEAEGLGAGQRELPHQHVVNLVIGIYLAADQIDGASGHGLVAVVDPGATAGLWQLAGADLGPEGEGLGAIGLGLGRAARESTGSAAWDCLHVGTIC